MRILTSLLIASAPVAFSGCTGPRADLHHETLDVGSIRARSIDLVDERGDPVMTLTSTALGAAFIALRDPDDRQITLESFGTGGFALAIVGPASFDRSP